MDFIKQTLLSSTADKPKDKILKIICFSSKKIISILVPVFLLITNISYGLESEVSLINTRGLTLRNGIASDQVRLLKDFFRVKNKNHVTWGYFYDTRTKELVTEYQSSMGLKVDGIAGKETLHTINREIKEKKLNIGLRIPVVSNIGDLIIINKSSNTLYFINNGIIKKSYPVATGKTMKLTPNGKFKIVVKAKNPYWLGAGVSEPIKGGDPANPLGTRWIGISYGGGNIYGVHGNSSPSSIGTYASLGCVRMFNYHVEELYERVKANTPIWIGTEDILETYGVKFIHNYIEYEKEKPIEENIKETDFKVIINGEIVNLINPILSKKGTTYYPFREILETIEATVIWDQTNKIVTGILDSNYVQFQIDNTEYIDREGYKYLPEGKEAFVIEGATYIPIRNLMESLGFNVDWEQESRSIVIENIDKEDEIEDTKEVGDMAETEDKEELEDKDLI